MLKKMYWKMQWTARRVLKSRNIHQYVRSGDYIDKDITKGIITTCGKNIHWGSQYRRLMFFGMID